MPKRTRSRRYAQRRVRRRLAGPINVRRTMTRLKRRSMINRIKRTVLKMSELKIKSGSLGEIQLLHDVPSNLGDIFQTAFLPSQGDAENQRVGNKIFLSGSKIKMMLLHKGDRPNVTFKIWVIKVDQSVNYTYATIFDNVSGNLLLDDIDNNRVAKIVYQKTIKRSPTATNGTQFKEWTFPVKIWIPYKREVQFKQDAAADSIIPYKYLLLVGAYDTSGSLITDNIASVTEYHRVYYRDF